MCEVPLKRTEWDHMSSFLQVKPVLWSGAVATFHRAYHDSQRGRSDVKLYYSHVKKYPFCGSGVIMVLIRMSSLSTCKP